MYQVVTNYTSNVTMLLKQVTYHTLNSTLGWGNPLFFVWKVPRPSPLDHHRQINAFLSLTWRCLASQGGRWEPYPEAGTQVEGTCWWQHNRGTWRKGKKDGKNRRKNRSWVFFLTQRFRELSDWYLCDFLSVIIGVWVCLLYSCLGGWVRICHQVQVCLEMW